MNVPCGLSAGLPVGMQLVGRALQRVDDLPRRARLRAARRLAQLLTRRAANAMSANPFSSDWLDGGARRPAAAAGHAVVRVGRRPTSRCASSPSRSSSTRPCARHGPRDAAIFEAEGVRLSWYDLKRRADELAAGLLALGLAARQPRRHLGAEPPRVAGHAVRDRARRPRPGQHQPGVPQDRARVRAQQGRLPRAGDGAPLQEQRLPRHARRDRARDPLQGRQRGARQRAAAGAQARGAARRRAGAAALPVVPPGRWRSAGRRSARGSTR